MKNVSHKKRWSTGKVNIHVNPPQGTFIKKEE